MENNDQTIMTPQQEEVSVEEMEAIHNAILEKDENGYSPCFTSLDLSVSKGIKELDEISDENMESITGAAFDKVKISMFTKDFLCRDWYVSLEFDGTNTDEHKDTMFILNKFRDMVEAFEMTTEAGDAGDFPILSLTLSPYVLEGEFFVHYVMPMDITQTTNENGENCVFILHFGMENIQYIRNTLTAEERTEIEADILGEEQRRKELGTTSTSLFAD